MFFVKPPVTQPPYKRLPSFTTAFTSRSRMKAEPGSESQPQEICFSHNGVFKDHTVMYSLQQLQHAPVVQLHL